MNCANCGGQYSPYSFRNSCWCKKEGVFLCQKCLGEGQTCPSCGSQVSHLASMLVFQGLIFLLVLGFVAAVSLPNDFANQGLNPMRVTPVSQLTDGLTEKVFGTVSSGQSTVIAVWDYKDQFGGTVTGRHVKNFWVNDSSGRVLIEMGSNYSSTPTIAYGGEPYTAPGAFNGFQYSSGDPISIIGPVVPVGNGSGIQAMELAPGPTSFAHGVSIFDELFFGVPFSICLGAIAAGTALTRYRLRQHERHLSPWIAKRPKALEGPPTTDEIRWMANPSNQKSRFVALAVNLVSVALVAVFLIVVVSPIPFPDSVYTLVLVGVPFVLLFTGVVGVLTWYGARHGVVRLGTSNTGVYLDYRHPPRNARNFLAWSDIRELEAPLAVNRHAVRFDTPLGRELVPGLSLEVISFLRSEFEAKRAPYRDPSAPIRPSVASLLGKDTSPSPTDVVWSRNSFRNRWFLRGALLLVLEIPALLLFLLTLPRIGINRGDALFFLPLLFGAQLIYLAFISIREVGVSPAGFSLRERRGERTIPWSEIAELTPGPRGIRYKTQTGFAEAVGGLDSSMVQLIVDGLYRSEGLPPVAPALRPLESAWLENPVHRTARNLLLLVILGPAVTIGLGVTWLILQPLNPYALFLAVLPVIVVAFAAYPFVLWKGSPIRIAVSSDTLFVDTGGRDLGPGSVTVLPISSIASAKTGQVANSPSAGTPSSFLGIRSTPIVVRTVGRVNLAIGPVAPSVAQAVAARLRPDQLQEWKLST